MTIDEFWGFIDKARAEGGDSPEARVEALRGLLLGSSAAQLTEFNRHYDEVHALAYRWDLWGAAYVMNGGCSDDGFHYFRAWLISEGRARFEAALENPESLADVEGEAGDEFDNESFGYVALELFEECADGGGEMEQFSSDPESPAGEEWEESELEERFPRLSAKFG